MQLHYLAGPLIGAVIGYFTNYLAVKMLFHPKKPVIFFGHTLPFTPGVIPKGKSRLARAVGQAVGKTLLTGEDIENYLLSDEMQQLVISTVNQAITVKFSEGILPKIPTEEYQKTKGIIVDHLATEIINTANEMKLGEIIAKQAGNVAKEKIKNSFFAMMINDDLIASITKPIGKSIEDYINENGKELLIPVLNEKITHIEESSCQDFLQMADISNDTIEKIILNAYKEFVISKLEKFLSHIDISKIVEDKINQMSVDELEDLVLSVMKHELNLIVNLGALIGFILGLLNLIIPSM